MEKISLFSLFIPVTVAVGILSSNATSNFQLIRLLKDIHNYEQFQSVFLLINPNPTYDDIFIKDTAVALDIPIILASDKRPLFIKPKFNSILLAIVYLESISDESTLQQLFVSLNRMRSTKTIFLINNPSRDDLVLQHLFNLCWDNDMINVLAVFSDFADTSTYYGYTNMPSFGIEVNRWVGGPPSDGYYPDRMRDLKGRELPVIFGGSEPKIIISKDKHGKPIIGGYAGHIFTAMAKKHNANLSSPKINKVLAAQKLGKFVINKTVDISSATTYLFPLECSSYPYEILDWCVMLPIEPTIPTYEIFTIIFQWQTLLITLSFIVILSALLESSVYLSGRRTSLANYFIQDRCLRGALGQSFLELPNSPYSMKIIYLIICLIGILIVTSYDAYLQTYMYSPPSEKKIESFDDLLASDIKVYALRQEYALLEYMKPEFSKKYLNMFLFENDFATYVSFRDQLNTSYAYSVNNIKWIIVQEQQKLSTHILFRQNKDMCLAKALPMSFPVHENSIYREILNFLILETYSSGLLEFWQRRSFNELIETGKLNFLNWTGKPNFVPLRVEDLQLIWIGMAAGLFAAFVCFLGEVLTVKVKWVKVPYQD